jgi:hypothetical protein
MAETAIISFASALQPIDAVVFIRLASERAPLRRIMDKVAHVAMWTNIDEPMSAVLSLSWSQIDSLILICKTAPELVHG